MALGNERSFAFSRTNEYIDMKAKVHDRLIEVLDLSLIDSLDQTTLKRQIRELTEEILSEDQFSMPLNPGEREQFYQEIQDEVTGLGPIEPFMRDSGISDIMVNGYRQVYVEKSGKLHHTDVRFRDDDHLRKVIDRIVSSVGRRIDEFCPMVDARLPDGSRVNAVIPPIAVDGPLLSIRRFAVDPLELEDLIKFRTLTPEIGELLQGIVKARLNVLISGGTGSGKTTLLNVLSRFIPADERIITIEDAAELQLKQEHVVRMETRPANIEGKGEISTRELVRNSLRMRPERIIVGEVRGAEVLDMLQAMNTGHDGSLTTIHANTPFDALIRVETLVSMSGLTIPHEAVRRYISSALNVIIQTARLVDGSRKVVSLQEITGMEGNIISRQEIFSFEQTGVDNNGKVKGRFRMTGVLPKFVDRFKARSIPFSYEHFSTPKVLEI
ncbi:MAG: CpaF family protein [bacterium]